MAYVKAVINNKELGHMDEQGGVLYEGNDVNIAKLKLVLPMGVNRCNKRKLKIKWTIKYIFWWVKGW